MTQVSQAQLYWKKGLEFIYVGDNDSSQDKWRQAIKEDGVEMMHHVLRGLPADFRPRGDGKFPESDISKHFDVSYLPTKVLIDDKGCIVGKLKDEELDTKLKEVYGE